MPRLHLTDDQASVFLLEHRDEYPDLPALEGFDEWFKERYGRLLFASLSDEGDIDFFFIDFKTDLDLIEWKLTHL